MDKNEILLGFGIIILVILLLSLLLTYLSLLKMTKKLDETLDEVADLRYRIIDSKIMDIEYYENYIKEWNNSNNGIYISDGE